MRPIYQAIDDLITSKAKPFLETSQGYSDIVVEKGNIALKNAFAKPDKINELLAGHVAGQVRMLHIKSAHLKIPWFAWHNGIEITLDSLFIVIQPLLHDNWTLEEVRKAKEDEIVAAVTSLFNKEKEAEKKAKAAAKQGEKPNLFQRLKQQVLTTPVRVKVSNVHIRYEHFEEETGKGFAAGFIVHNCDVTKASVSDAVTLDSVHVNVDAGAYCRIAYPRGTAPDSQGEHASGFHQETARNVVKDGEAAAEAEQQQQQTKPSPERISSAGAHLERRSSAGLRPERKAGAGAPPGFFAAQETMAKHMRGLIETSKSWGRQTWLLGPISLSASLHKVAGAGLAAWKGKLDDSSAPVPRMRLDLRIEPLSVNVTDEQLARFIALANRQKLLKLRAAYSLRRPGDLHQKPARGASARAFWSSACAAVQDAYLPPKSLRGASLGLIIAQKRRYVQLVSTNMPPTDLDEPDEFHGAVATLPPAVREELQHIEDEVAAPLIAWWRVVSLHASAANNPDALRDVKVKVDAGGEGNTSRRRTPSVAARSIQGRFRQRKKGSKQPAEPSAAEHGDAGATTAPASHGHGLGHGLQRMRTRKKDQLGFDKKTSDEIAESLLPHDDEAGPAPFSDEVLEAAAPLGFLFKAVSVRVDALSVRMLQGAATAALPAAVAERELLRFDVVGVHVRSRTLAQQGKRTHLVVRSVVATSGLMTPPGTKQPRWCLLRIDGEAAVGVPDELLGGALPDELKALDSPAKAAPAKRTRPFGMHRKKAGSANDEPAQDELEPSLPIPLAAQGRSSARLADDEEACVALHICANQAAKPPPGAAEAGELSALEVAVQRIDYTYAAVFWSLVATFTSGLELEMQRSPSLATAQLRARYPRMLRGLSEHLRRPWWTAEIKGMTAFLSSAALLTSAAGFPSLRVRLLGGVALQLAAAPDGEADAVSSASSKPLMTMTVPPLEIQRAPQTNGGTQSSVRFAEQILVASPKTEGLLARLLGEGAVSRGTIPQSAEHPLHKAARAPVVLPAASRLPAPTTQLAPPSQQPRPSCAASAPATGGQAACAPPVLPRPSKKLPGSPVRGDSGSPKNPMLFVMAIAAVALALFLSSLPTSDGRLAADGASGMIALPVWMVAAPYAVLLACAGLLSTPSSAPKRPAPVRASTASSEMV